ncbi:hypothetical protein ACDX78_18725 [Virgibacillus oceani]
MKKKLISFGIVVVLVLGIGNAVYASGAENVWSFEEMLPFMKEMHPEMNEQQMEQMYQDCHGSSDEKVPKNNGNRV